MALPVVLVGTKGTRSEVTKSGEVVVAPLSYSDTVFASMETVDIAYNFFQPKFEKQFVITGLLAFADKDINDASATDIIVHEATAVASTVEDKVLMHFGMAKLSLLPFAPLNILVNSGVFVNAKTNDNNVLITITGYFIDKL